MYKERDSCDACVIVCVDVIMVEAEGNLKKVLLPRLSCSLDDAALF